MDRKSVVPDRPHPTKNGKVGWESEPDDITSRVPSCPLPMGSRGRRGPFEAILRPSERSWDSWRLQTRDRLRHEETGPVRAGPSVRRSAAPRSPTRRHQDRRTWSSGTSSPPRRTSLAGRPHLRGHAVGFEYVAFIVDAFSRFIAGMQVSWGGCQCEARLPRAHSPPSSRDHTHVKRGPRSCSRSRLASSNRRVSLSLARSLMAPRSLLPNGSLWFRKESGLQGGRARKSSTIA